MQIPNEIIAALIAIPGAILATLVVQSINRFFENKSGLVINVIASEIKFQPAITGMLRAEQRLIEDYKAEITRLGTNLRLLSQTTSIELEIENKSKKKITNLMLSLKSHIEYIAQIDGGAPVERDKGVSLGLGDVQPSRKIAVNVWCQSGLFGFDDKLLQFSADEHVAITVRYPLPAYIQGLAREKRTRVINKLLNMAIIVGIIAAVYLVFKNWG